jgi:hypothetical protein
MILLVTFAERTRTSGGVVNDAAVEGAAQPLAADPDDELCDDRGMLHRARFGEGGDQTAPRAAPWWVDSQWRRWPRCSCCRRYLPLGEPQGALAIT